MTDHYAVIGHPVAHSKSPRIHALFAAQTGQDMTYEAIEAPLDDFAGTVARLRSAGFRGCNVTVPFKFEAFKLATRRSARAESAQAVNTLNFSGEVIEGDNTDGAGLVRDIENNLGIMLQGRRVLLMGAGGAAYGVVLPLLQAGANLTVVNRTPEKAIALAETFPDAAIQAGGYAALDASPFDVVINATSSGLTDELPPLPETALSSATLAYDMMYGRETPFMALARTRGARIADGLGMLVEQAAEAFFVWRGVRPDTQTVLSQLRKT
jgi:shikimate dehydrogenase